MAAPAGFSVRMQGLGAGARSRCGGCSARSCRSTSARGSCTTGARRRRPGVAGAPTAASAGRPAAARDPDPARDAQESADRRRSAAAAVAPARRACLRGDARRGGGAGAPRTLTEPPPAGRRSAPSDRDFNAAVEEWRRLRADRRRASCRRADAAGRAPPRFACPAASLHIAPPHAGSTPMIVELGHLALILAFLVALVQAVVPMVGAQRGWADWMRVAAPAASAQFALTAAAFLALMWAFVTSDFSVQAGGDQLAFGQADALQDQRHLGEPRGLDAALDADPDAVRGDGRLVGQEPAARAQGPRAERAGDDRAWPSSPSSCGPRTRSRGSTSRRSTATGSTRCCRTPASPSTRRSSTSATSGSRWPIPSPSPR